MKIVNEEHRYIIARWMYSIGEELITDENYNRLHRYLISKNLLLEYTNRSWSSDPCPVQLLKYYELDKYAHDIIRSDKTESMMSIIADKDVNERYDTKLDEYILSYKIDGFNMQLTYHNGELVHMQTRGRSSDYKDIYHLREVAPKRIPVKGKVRIIVEGAISDKNFIELKKRIPEKEVKSQRSSVSTIIANTKLTNLLTLVAFNIITDEIKFKSQEEIYMKLNTWGFNVVPYVKVDRGALVLSTTYKMGEQKKKYGVPSDGIVCINNINNSDVRAIRVGAWAEMLQESYITGYEETRGGQMININLKIKPIRLTNSTQERVTITNLARVVNNKLEIGSPIAFTLRSDAIAVPDLNETRMLQDMWKGHFEEYRHNIELRELSKNI